MTAGQKIVRLKILLDDLEPEVERWIILPLEIRLDRPHEAPRAATGRVLLGRCHRRRT